MAVRNRLSDPKMLATLVAALLAMPTVSRAQNTLFGTGALSHNTMGNYNTALGYDALFFNTTGNNNTATGLKAQ
jgi:hypothetical protein